jgi:cellulose synthase/poly-beta-1,6-N-acetylglucosamine synthase-like glycosyltransferase
MRIRPVLGCVAGMATFTVVAVVAAALSMVWFVCPPGGRRYRPRRRRPSSAAARAGGAALGVTVAACAVGAFTGWRDVVLPAVLLWVGSCLWLPGSRRWSGTAHVSWSLSVLAGVGYVVTMAAWTVSSGLMGLTAAAAWGLWGLEVLAFVMFLSYGYEFHDALGSRRWDRRIGPALTRVPDAELPFVSIHVPCHNEPTEMVIATLETLLALDYPSYEVLVIDNNTPDDALVAPVEAFCEAHREVLRFHRLLNWPGYKSGALNYAETVTDRRATVVGVVDSDYQVSADWLRDTAPLFADESVAFVQTPQNYRSWAHSRYLRSLYYSYGYFFAVSQPSRDERDAAIFGGTMGLVRRAALRRVGGWDEWCVTEDADLSLRLLGEGWTGHHVDQAYGAGIMPLTFEALKRQRFRWCFGGMQILKQHWRELLPWSSNAMSNRQRLGYLAGGLQWFGDVLTLVFGVVVVASLWDLTFGEGLVVRRLGGLLLLAMPGLLLLGLVRAVGGIRRVGDGATWRDALGALLVWQSLGWVVVMACLRGLLEPHGVFLRTPKVHDHGRAVDALKANAVELGFALCAVGSAVVALVIHPSWEAVALSALLLLPVSGWVAAPAHSVAALRTTLPAPLQRRRERERRAGRRSPARWSLASIAAVGVVASLIFFVLQPRSGQAPAPVVLPALPRVAVPTEAPGPSGSGSVPTTSGTTSPASSTPASGSTTAKGTAAPSSVASASGASASPSSPTPADTVRPTGSPTQVPTSTTPPSQPGRSPTAPPGSPTTHPGPTTTR